MHKAIVITDLTFGDAGKGAVVDALARRGASLVVRHNGGAQASHTVVDATSGRRHAFRQFGSGMFVEDVETFLSRYMLVNPIALYQESEALRDLGVGDAMGRLHIDGRALVTTPYHIILNQMRELARGEQHRHGSCGLGIGETAADSLEFGPAVLTFGDLADEALMRRKLRWHHEVKHQQAEALMPGLLAQEDPESKLKVQGLRNQLESRDELEATAEVFAAVSDCVHVAAPDFLSARMRKPGGTVFEGAQGVLLDENYGFHPYTTWSTTTPANALDLIREAGAGDVETTVLGITRAYQTRHGAGPFPTESDDMAFALPEPDNPANHWQGSFRAGWLDLSLLRYAVSACGRIDGLVMTCLDRLRDFPEVKIGVGYARNGFPWELEADYRGNLSGIEAGVDHLRGLDVRGLDVIYMPAPKAPDAYVSYVAEQLHLPLLGASYGPTARNKEFDLKATLAAGSNSFLAASSYL